MSQNPSILHKHASKALALLLAPLLSLSCQQESHQQPGPGGESLPIHISAQPEAHATRVTDTAFEDDDQVGVYVVNRIGDKQASLLASGNHADNARFTYHGTWTPDQPLYWLDEDTHADFYLYSPYDSQMGDPHHWSVTVPTDQSTEAAMRQADMLVGRTMDVAPAAQAVHISARHLMSRMEVVLQPGDGFTREELLQAQVEVSLCRIRTLASIDIATATATAMGEAQATLRPWQSDTLRYVATIVPQEVGEGTLINVLVNGDRYRLSRAVTFRAGTIHRATVTLKRAQGSVSVGITGWETDGEDYGGIAE